MKKSDIQIGHTYTAKVSDKVVPVRIEGEHPRGGWIAINFATGKTVRIKSAQRLRAEVRRDGGVAEVVMAVTNGNLAEGVTVPMKPGRKKQVASEPKARSQRNPTPRETNPKKLSLLDAAAHVLAESNEPMTVKQMLEQVIARNLWMPGAGKTPHATLAAAIIREIAGKGDKARFTKVDRGQFQARKGA
ncbi:MAG: winged helix-turn-helix domain-containing protein [Phycisphaeraceae bacterium]|nr:winged helix-turn-helix domain-containing protein [Phycisphaeraceae bacterium]